MTALELDNQIRELAPSWLVKEVDSFISNAKLEEWDDQPESCIECFDWFQDQDWTDTRKFRMAMTKLERACGVQRKLQRGEVCQTFTSRGNSTKTEGAWVFEKQWHELITEVTL